MADMLPCAVWNESLLVGHEKIDAEHKGIFELAAKLQSIDVELLSPADTKDILRQLVDYATNHLGHEEGLMQASEYPYITGHSVEHWKFIRQLAAIISDFESGSKEALPNCLSFITNWLTKHILVNDVQLAEFLNRTVK